MRVTLACTPAQRLIGLFAHPDLDGVLLLAPCHDVHTFGMREPLDIAFLDSGFKVIASYRNVAPGKRVTCTGAVATIERYARHGPWPEPGARLALLPLEPPRGADETHAPITSPAKDKRKERP